MTTAFLEAVVFLGVLAALFGLVRAAYRKLTSQGQRAAQRENAQEAFDAALHTCPTHGFISPDACIRTADGVLKCPRCYLATLHQTTHL